MIESKAGGNAANLSYEDALEAIKEAMTVLYYRDCRYVFLLAFLRVMLGCYFFMVCIHCYPTILVNFGRLFSLLLFEFVYSTLFVPINNKASEF